jgi:hypothetical protein
VPLAKGEVRVRETSPGEALEARLNQEMTRLRRVPANHRKSDDELVKLAHDALYGNNSVENIAACHSAQLEPTINLTSSYAGCAQWAPMFHNIRWAYTISVVKHRTRKLLPPKSAFDPNADIGPARDNLVRPG